jgi:hypothetical protein
LTGSRALPVNGWKSLSTLRCEFSRIWGRLPTLLRR